MPIVGILDSAKIGNLAKPSFALYTSGGSTIDYTTAVAADSSGNLYFAGTFNNRASLVSIDSEGTFRWGRSIRANNQNANVFDQVRVGADGFVYVSGQGGGFGGPNDCAILAKYSTSGTQQWITTRAGEYARFSDLNFDSLGNIYTTGQVAGNTTFGITISKYNSSGTFVEGYRNSTGLGNCSSNGVTVDNNGDIYIAGRSDSTSVGNGGVGNKSLLIKMNSSFAVQWSKSIDNGSASGRYNASWFATQINRTGNVYVSVAQSSANSGGGVMVFNTSGAFQWARSIIDTSNGGGTWQLTHDGTDLYVSGYTAGPSVNPLTWIKLNTSGTTLLSRKWSTNQNMYGLGIALPGTAELVVSGYTYVTASDYRQFVAQVPRNGSKTGSIVLGSQTYTYATGTASVASYTPTVGDLSLGFTSLPSPTTYSTDEQAISPTLIKGAL